MSPFQKGESVGLTSTWDKVWFFTYLLYNSCCHVPSSDSSFKNHLLSKHLFFSSRTSIPKPPWSLGWQNSVTCGQLYEYTPVLPFVNFSGVTDVYSQGCKDTRHTRVAPRRGGSGGTLAAASPPAPPPYPYRKWGLVKGIQTHKTHPPYSQEGRLGRNPSRHLPLHPCFPRRRRRMHPVKRCAAVGGGRLLSPSMACGGGGFFLLVWWDLRSELHGDPGQRSSIGGDDTGAASLGFFGDRCGHKGGTTPDSGDSVWLYPSSPRSAGGGGGARWDLRSDVGR
jgi:hypothetical protein